MKEHKKDKPNYKLIYYEAYLSEKDARVRNSNAYLWLANNF